MVLTLTGCLEQDDDCAKAVCTEEFRFLTIKLMYPGNEPVALDSAKVRWVERNVIFQQREDIWEESRQNGVYHVVDDSMKSFFYKNKATLQFSAFLDGKVVHKQEVIVTAGCCHIDILSNGPFEKIIQRDPDVEEPAD